MREDMPGKLYVCGTPIGNLEDASIRLIKTLRRVDMIACEDTRHTLKLLNRYKIKNRLVSYHEHSSKSKEEYILQQLSEGRQIALVSDAGMPAISDPGESLVRKAIESGLEVEVVPGPTACTAALAISGFNSETFVFIGFLPNRQTRRVQALRELEREARTIVLYEAPHRLLETLRDIKEVLGEDRMMAAARELTKVHQELRRATAQELEEYFTHNPPRGEFCLLIEALPSAAGDVNIEQAVSETRALIDAGINKKEALKIKAREYKIKKSILYKYFVDEGP
jgi:16S rRNA (cytidine1402-2'-O)-methyltransferase